MESVMEKRVTIKKAVMVGGSTHWQRIEIDLENGEKFALNLAEIMRRMDEYGQRIEELERKGAEK